MTAYQLQQVYNSFITSSSSEINCKLVTDKTWVCVLHADQIINKIFKLCAYNVTVV